MGADFVWLLLRIFSTFQLKDPEQRFTYLMAIRRISFFDNFLSGGCVGTSLRSSANAPDTFCCLHLSLEFVKIFLTT